MAKNPETAAAALIELRVALHADLRKYLAPGETGPRTVQLPSSATVEDLLRALRIPESEIVTVGINGVLAPRTAALHDNDDITMFSPMEGG